MKIVNHCVCCNSTNIIKYRATIEDFVLNRMLGDVSPRPAEPNQMIHCQDCNYAGSSYRFDQDEEKRYYTGYMGPEYAAARGCQAAAAYYDSEIYKALRRDMCSTTLLPFIDFSSIQSVLDYGGNTGEMIPTELNHASRYVVDTEPRLLPTGATAISDPSQSGPVDLVICGHTLEHVSYPLDVLKDLVRYVRSGTWFYLEVPVENEGKYSDGYNFSEHINYFRDSTLEKLLELTGFELHLSKMEIYYNSIGHVFIVVGRFK
jgi:SAM-dependent methyltransferase